VGLRIVDADKVAATLWSSHYDHVVALIFNLVGQVDYMRGTLLVGYRRRAGMRVASTSSRRFTHLDVGDSGRFVGVMRRVMLKPSDDSIVEY
jgi:hypothetical protein